MTNLVMKSSVQSDIKKFYEMFKDNPLKHIQEGTWLAEILKKILFEHALEVDVEYFKTKYVGLSNEQIANQMINLTSSYAAIAGGLAASAITVAELTSMKKNKASLFAVGASSLIGEISYISYIQMKLIYDISVLYDARLDSNDPEDLLQVFWQGLGVNVWQSATNTALKAAARSTTYLSRKVLRSGIRKAMIDVAIKFGGTKLAKRITEKTLMKLIVPGINIPIASTVNWKFTKLIGKNAVASYKARSTVLSVLDFLADANRYEQIVAVPIVFQIGIADQDAKKIGKNVEMQSAVVKRLNLSDEEEKTIDGLAELGFEEFCKELSKIEDNDAKKNLLDIAVYSYILSKNENDEKITQISKALGIDLDNMYLNNYKKRLR